MIMKCLILILSLLVACVLSTTPISQFVDKDYGPPQPYTFGYKVHDKDGDQWRSEVSDGHGKVEGSYGYVDNLGMKREVKYIADDNGFRANIKTNEPGMDMPNPADVIMSANPPSDYDATIYGIEAIPRSQLISSKSQEQLNQEVKDKLGDFPKHDSKGFYKYHRFAEQSVPPIYVINGHLQSPWFPLQGKY